MNTQKRIKTKMKILCCVNIFLVIIQRTISFIPSDDFAIISSSLAHEIKNSLSIIRLRSGILKSEKYNLTKEENKKNADKIELQVDHLVKIIDGMQKVQKDSSDQ